MSRLFTEHRYFAIGRFQAKQSARPAARALGVRIITCYRLQVMFQATAVKIDKQRDDCLRIKKPARERLVVRQNRRKLFQKASDTMSHTRENHGRICSVITVHRMLAA